MIEAAMKELPRDCLHVKTKVNALTRSKNGSCDALYKRERKKLRPRNRATYGHQALELLNKTATHKETSILSGFKTDKHVAILHSIYLLCQRDVLLGLSGTMSQSHRFWPHLRSKPARRCALHTG
ncbi:hypothetical protein GJ744_002737 [Endocarpon pusillum]|uniref:Uncharacterized protein n=1 Tax=Endocarpon pusillum TaxID=364733 RepID=A0A8H7APM7_9EURO|nr:hypothetical protein GJ744_002737 [Endocarpon pusillum]